VRPNNSVADEKLAQVGSIVFNSGVDILNNFKDLYGIIDDNLNEF
jgi:hypothetical protein